MLHLIAGLRQGDSTRKPRSTYTHWRGQIPDIASIHVSPPEVKGRVMPAPRGWGLIRGVAVLMDRRTRLILLAKIKDATAASALKAFTAKLNSIAEPMRQPRTYNQGKEMSRHLQLA